MESRYVVIPVMENPSYTVYECYITINGADFRMRVEVATGEEMSNAQVECEWELQRQLIPYSGIIEKILAQSADVESFMNGFYGFVSSVVEENSRSLVGHPESSSSTVPHILSQMNTLGWDKLDSIDPTFQQVNLKLYDSKGRTHILHVNLKPQAREENSVCTVDLPIKSDFHLKPGEQISLHDLLDQFQDMLRKCEDFWDMMFEIDHKTWVLEPEKPSPSTCHRRIAIDTNASLQIKVDAYHPRLLPECRFLGADVKVAPFKEKLNNNLHKWNVNSSLLENLHNVLDMILPSPSDVSKEKFTVECGICYSYRMDNQIPNKVCDDQRCGQAFHQECLYEWLRVLPSSRQSFNMIFGECPFCSKSITVKMSTKENA